MSIRVGCTLGVLYERCSSEDSLRYLRKAGVTTIELNQSMGTPGAVDIAAFPWELTKGLEHVSIHAPAHAYGTDAQTDKIFECIRYIHQQCPVSYVVVHPDTVHDFSVFEKLGIPIAFENMDWRKGSHKTPAEMQELLDREPDAGMVLDVNHIYTNDRTMESVDDFYRLCGDRIVGIHVSGFETLHEPLYRTQQQNIVVAIKNVSVPIIIESQLQQPEEIELEVEYVKSAVNALCL